MAKGRATHPPRKNHGPRSMQGERLMKGKNFVIVSQSGRVFRGKLLTTFFSRGSRGAIFTSVR